MTSSSVVETTEQQPGRDPGGRPRCCAAHLRRRGRPPGHLRRGDRGPGPGPLHHLAPARGAGEQPAAGALRARRVRRWPAVRPLRRPPRPQRAAGPARAADARADRREHRRGRPPRGRQRRRTSPTSPRSTRPTSSAPATGPTSRSRRTARPWARSCSPGTPCRGRPAGSRRRPATPCAPGATSTSTSRRPAPAATPITRDELEVGLAGVAAPVFGPDKDVVAAVGVSGPTARLEDRVDSLGRLLKDQTEELSELLRHGTPHEQGPERDTA